MVPVGEERPQRRDESKRLVEHDVMTRLRDFDDGRGPPQQAVHVFADLGGQQYLELTPHDRDAAALGRKPVANILPLAH